MTRKERVRYEMLLRVRGFGNTHRELFPDSSTGGEIFARVAQTIAEIEAHSTTKLLAAKDGRQARTVARAIVTHTMRAIVRTARGVARTAPDDDNKFQLPRRKSDVALLTTARSFLREAEASQDGFVRLGLSPTFLIDFRKAVDTFEDTMRERREGRSNVAAAQAGITAALAAGADAVRLLDVVIANAVEHDPVVFAAWKRDRRVVEGQSKSEPHAAAPVTAQTPAAEAPGDPLRRAS